MTRTVWLASYPKSGNTWFRMLIANLQAAEDSGIDINNLPERGGIASARGPFDHLTLIDSGLLTHDEIDLLRPAVYEMLAAGAEDDLEPAAGPAFRFVKVHDAYTVNQNGVPLLAGAKGADAAIVIVRDPRAVAPSLAHHLHQSIDTTIDFMADAKAGFCQSRRSQAPQLRQQLPGWSGHIDSWLGQRDIPVHLIRYEDLKADPVTVFTAALAFAGYPADEERIARAVRLADFVTLQAQEQTHGFREARAEARFFRRGETEAWREELNAAQIARIETAHAEVMSRLGYPWAAAQDISGAQITPAQEGTTRQ